MTRRWLIALVLSWGLPLGLLAAFGVAVVLLGFGWVFLYGDDPWPTHFTGLAVPLAAAAAGAGAFLGVVAAARQLSRSSGRIAQLLQTNPLLRWGSLLAPVLLVGGFFWSLLSGTSERASAEPEAVNAAEPARHHLTESAWRLDRESGQLRIDMTADGVAPGSYSLLWEAKASGMAKPLGIGSVREQLPAAPSTSC